MAARTETIEADGATAAALLRDARCAVCSA